MRKTIAVVMLLTLALWTPRGEAQAPTATPLDSAAWDYADADLATYAVTRFELCLDGATTGCVAVEPAAGKFTPSDPAPAGVSSYRMKLPAMTPGAHTLVVRACNVSGCTGGEPIAFSMTIKPVPPTWRGFVSGG